MIEIRLLCYILIKKARLFLEFAYRHRRVIAKHTEHLGQAAYTAAFLYLIEKGFDLNALNLAVIGLLLVWLAKRLKQ